MSLHRVILVALATLFTGVTSAAFAGCCEWGAAAPVVYASSYSNGCGGCGVVSGCGGCGAQMTYAVEQPAPVYAEPVMPAPVPVATWGTGCGCHQSVFYAAAAYVEPQIVPAPIYVVNQGPEYSGPGIMMPYRTWSPSVAAAIDYPYISRGYGRPYYHGARYAYREHGYGRPHWWRYPHRPLGVRD
jgi:hypothetical protein